MKRFVFAVFCAALVAFTFNVTYAGGDGSDTSDMSATITSETPAFPFEGKVTASPSLRMRGGAGVEFLTLAYTKTGETLTITGMDGDWYTVEPPAGLYVWMARKYVDEKGVLTGDNVYVRPKPKTYYTVLGKIGKGTQLEIVGESGEYYQVKPPAGIHVFCHSKYIEPVIEKIVETPAVAEPVVVEPEKIDPGAEMLAAADKLYEAAKAKPIEEWDFSVVRGKLEEILAVTEDKYIIAEVSTRIDYIDLFEDLKAQNDKTVSSKEQLAAQIGDIRARYEAELERIRNASVKEEPTYIATGWLKGVGLYFGRPADYRLTKGEKTTYFLRNSDGTEFKFSNYLYKRVGVVGEVVEENGHRFIIVSRIDGLK